MNYEILKNWRIMLVIASVMVSIFLIGPSFQQGVIVASVPTNSAFTGKVAVGEVITWANEKTISTPEDFYSFDNFTGSFRFVHNGKLDIINLNQGGLDIFVTSKPSTNLQFGLDLVGGTRVLLKPKDNVTAQMIEQIISTLETRVNVFGLKEVKFQPISDVSGINYVQIEMAGGTKKDIEDLLAKQGYFEAKIPITVSFNNNTGSFALGSTHSVLLKNDSIEINNTLLKENDTSAIEGINFQVINLTDDKVVLFFIVFNGDDIQSVCIQDQPGICTSRVVMVQGGYEFNFQVFITQNGAERFANLTKNMKVISDPTTGEKYLESKIYFYLDRSIMTSLNIGSDMKGQAFTSPAITGYRESRNEAVKEQLMIKSILQSGSLPTSLEIIRTDQISPNLGHQFFESALLAMIIAEIAVAGVIFIRYRQKAILVQMMLWSLAELAITLGVAAMIKQTIDLSAIAGLIAAIGTGTNDQIIMIDGMLAGGSEKKKYTLKQRIRSSFFVIFGAAGTVFAAMLPMMFVGIGVMRGFAIVTTIGILIGVLITRPAFPIVAEKLLGKKVSETTEDEEKKIEKQVEKSIESEARKDNLSKEQVIKAEGKDLLDMASNEMFGKSFGELTKEQREEIKKVVLEAEENETKQ
ncbi:MAG: MMPL family transporter [Candidatus Aenigmatarchaeota archaeon]